MTQFLIDLACEVLNKLIDTGIYSEQDQKKLIEAMSVLNGKSEKED